MQTLRLYIRMPLIVLWLALIWPLRLLLWPVALFSEPLDRRIRCSLFRLFGRGLAMIIGMKVEIRGPRPEPPYYVVANHLSYVDIFLLAYALGCVFVARGDVKHWPLIGWMARSIQVLFIDRERKEDAHRVNQEIEHTLAQADGIAVFAESRISRGLDV